MTKYVLGFLFDDEFVLLVKKTRGPRINLNKFNGIGGKVEDFEHVKAAMIREFKEETSFEVENWEYFGVFKGKDFEVTLFKSYDEIGEVSEFNDVHEFLQWEEIDSVTHSPYVNYYAQNVPTMIAHAVLGNGELKIYE